MATCSAQIVTKVLQDTLYILRVRRERFRQNVYQPYLGFDFRLKAE
jgi:hypothetical protein